MKPLKGMNQDISPASMQEGMYRKAQNFVYGKELDSLLQEPGMERLIQEDGTFGIMGCTPLREENFLLFTFDAGSVTGEGSAIRKYTASTGALTTIVANDEYNFKPSHVLSSAIFYNNENQENVIFTDNVNPIRIINIDSPEHDLTLNKLFAEFSPASITIDISTGVGGFDEGSHFFCVAFELEDGSQTPFHGITGPAIVRNGAGAFDINLEGIDQDYEKLLIGSISFVNAAIITNIQERVLITNSSMTVGVDNINPYKEASLEQLVGSGAFYTTAKTLTLHDNRLYLANLKEHEEDSLQAFANKVFPMWVYGDTAPGSSPYNINMSEHYYPKGMLFMPDEVYAFYISYIRKDGSSTRAFHIPGEAPTEITDKTDPWNGNQFYGYTFSSDATCAEIQLQYTAPIYNHLNNDIAIQGSEAKFFRMRTTAVRNTELNGADDGNDRGNMGFWENEDEIYPEGFPPQVRMTLGQGGELEFADDIVLEGKKVRHHKMPSLQWLGTKDSMDFGGYGENSKHNVKTPKMLGVEFDHVIIPVHYTGARIYYAKRTLDNATILGQAPLFHGHKNSYAKASDATVDAAYEDYAASFGINTQNQNATLSVGDTGYTHPDDSSFRAGIMWEKGRMHPPSMLEFKPAVSQNNKVHYIKQEFMLSTDASYPAGEYENWVFDVDDESGNFIQTLWDNNDFTDLEWRNRNVRFDCINSSEFHRVRNRHAVLGIQNSTYLAPGVVDTGEEWDNRGSEEALVFDIDFSQDPGDFYINNNPHNDFKLDYSYRLSAIIDSPTNGTADQGIYLDTISAAGAGAGQTSPVSTFAITNFCTNRENVYRSYETQDLVACTAIITADTLASVTTGPTNEVQQLGEKMAGYYGGAAGRVSHIQVFGDVAYGKHRARNTSQVGWNWSQTQPLSGGGTGAAVDALTSFSSDVGTVRISHEFPLMSPINPFFIDTEQNDMNIFTYLGSAERTIDPDQSNDYTYNISYLKSNDFRQPGIYTDETVTFPSLPYRVVRSFAQADDADDINLRYFPALDSFEQTRSRGEIVNIQSFNDRLIIHHELGLMVTRGQEKLATSSGEIVFGSGDIFATKPQEVVPSPDGYAGTQHQLSCLLTPSGYFFADESQGKIFQYTDKLVNIGALGLADYLKENLTIRKDLASTEAITGFYPGIQTSYDPRFERVIFHLRNFTGDSEIVPLAYQEIDGEDKGYYTEEGKEVKDFYLSFTPAISRWTSFHDYNSTTLVSTRNTLYSINTTEIELFGIFPIETKGLEVYKHSVSTEDTGSFVGKLKSSYIDVTFSFGAGAILSDFNWYTKAVEGNLLNISHKDHDTTFTHAIVSNDYQCSGEVALVKTESGNSASSNMRRSDFKWYFNGFRDLVLDRDVSFIDSQGEVIDSNIDATKAWYEQRRFVGNFVNVRLIIENSSATTKALYLYDVEAKIRKSYR
jgi:hypothetical protein